MIIFNVCILCFLINSVFGFCIIQFKFASTCVHYNNYEECFLKKQEFCDIDRFTFNDKKCPFYDCYESVEDEKNSHLEISSPTTTSTASTTSSTSTTTTASTVSSTETTTTASSSTTTSTESATTVSTTFPSITTKKVQLVDEFSNTLSSSLQSTSSNSTEVNKFTNSSLQKSNFSHSVLPFSNEVTLQNLIYHKNLALALYHQNSQLQSKAKGLLKKFENLKRRVNMATVDCPGSITCALSHDERDECRIYISTNVTSCNIPCDVTGCKFETIYEMTACPIWSCYPTPDPSPTPIPPHPSPHPDPGPAPSPSPIPQFIHEYWAEALTGLFGSILLILLLIWFSKKCRTWINNLRSLRVILNAHRRASDEENQENLFDMPPYFAFNRLDDENVPLINANYARNRAATISGTTGGPSRQSVRVPTPTAPRNVSTQNRLDREENDGETERPIVRGSTSSFKDPLSTSMIDDPVQTKNTGARFKTVLY